MITAALNTTGTTIQKLPNAPEQVDFSRKKNQEDASNPQDSVKKKDVQPEEILKQIKALTENGAYSVRFESDNTTHQMIVKIVDSKTQKVIRQVPAEELLGLREALDDFAGHIINTKS